jgi:murein DD-endopeptidase MepM/ murein hydrolase activator NlpD
MRSLMTTMLTMLVLVLVLSVGPVAGQSRPAATAAQHFDYTGPVTGVLTVLTPFAPPATRYGSGHLGVDVAAPGGAPVLAAGAGWVRFAGSVAGRGVVVILHQDGISTEYEPVAATVHAGERVTMGQRIGRVTGAHRSCAPSSCLHWGARRGVDYLDPMSLLRPLGVVRLLPWAG